MTRKKTEETPEARIERLRKEIAPDQYMKRLHDDLTVIVNELFYIGEKLQADVDNVPFPSTLMPTEHMVIVGYQFIDDNGDRGGDVRLLFRDGSMPSWVADGLVVRAQKRIDKSDVPAYFFTDQEDDGDVEPG